MHETVKALNKHFLPGDHPSASWTGKINPDWANVSFTLTYLNGGGCRHFLLGREPRCSDKRIFSFLGYRISKYGTLIDDPLLPANYFYQPLQIPQCDSDFVVWVFYSLKPWLPPELLAKILKFIYPCEISLKHKNK